MNILLLKYKNNFGIRWVNSLRDLNDGETITENNFQHILKEYTHTITRDLGIHGISTIKLTVGHLFNFSSNLLSNGINQRSRYQKHTIFMSRCKPSTGEFSMWNNAPEWIKDTYSFIEIKYEQ